MPSLRVQLHSWHFMHVCPVAVPQLGLKINKTMRNNKRREESHLVEGQAVGVHTLHGVDGLGTDGTLGVSVHGGDGVRKMR